MTLPLAIPGVGAGEGRPRRRLRRFAYRVTLTMATIGACLLLAFGALLLLTPSASQAPLLAEKIASARGIAYPGPPVPANFARPLVATEDKRFYSDDIGGEDPLALARVSAGAISGGPDQGGATIDLQLAKLLYVGAVKHKTVKGKLTEIALAFKLDFKYSKADVLRMYAEVAYYGHGYYGLSAASCGYFGHPPAQLTVAQGAMLAGVVNAPALDDPIRHPDQAHIRLAHVIARMISEGELTPAQGSALLNAPLGLTPGHSPSC
jgi:penicillin-binding protein 1A